MGWLMGRGLECFAMYGGRGGAGWDVGGILDRVVLGGVGVW